MFGAALLVALREGLEISLIMGIIFSYLRGLNRKDTFKPVWIGAGVAIGLSIILGIILYLFTGSEEWNGQIYLETAIFFVAVGILSYMTFWMKKNSRGMNKGIQASINTALNNDSGSFQLVLLAFLTIIREGLELVMFLLAISVEGKGDLLSLSSGTFVGLIIAVLIGWGIYQGTTKINLKVFFQVMGNILIVVAAGLLINAIHELIELAIIQPGVYLYNWENILNRHSAVGGILHALVGYTDHLSSVQLIVWLVYIIPAIILFNRNKVKTVPNPTA
ncbi:FTR1 family protein [Sporolactobacillus kofuensis]|uniref:FTR1 family protein n=1 Tax=Sporolactobacillus kofuensis TaxID=269672 RepID=A0ABW1WBU9_9BACL|nr:FTR1 family protein [Sporolactobacillus kofuensis]MCO7175181.1 FTR1 family protein [Sporolactobacillus kofuensis]